MKITLVLLTLNEIEGVRQIYEKIPFGEVDEAFAVDGGSTDGTVEFFKSKGLPVFPQTMPGRAGAFQAAFLSATGDALIFFSPDGNEDPLDIPKFRPFLNVGFDMVVGTRMIEGGHNEEDENFLKPRKWANNVFNWMANVTWNRGIYLTDTINGFRAITRQAWSLLEPDGPGYTIEYQCSIRAFKLGLRIAEFPTHEYLRIDGREGAPGIPTGLAFLRMYFSELWAGAGSQKAGAR